MLGIYTIATSVFMVFATALNSGIPVSISKFTAENLVDKNHKKTNSMVTSALIISLLLSVILVIVIFITKNLFLLTTKTDLTYKLLVSLIPALLFTGIYAPVRGYLWGKEKYLEASIVEFIEQIIRIIVSLILFFIMANSINVFVPTISLSIACVLSTILGIVFYFKSKGRFLKTNNDYKQIIKSSTPITLVRFVSSLMQPLLVILVPLQLEKVGYLREKALSMLGIAMNMTMPLLMIPSTIIGSLAMVLIPKISTLLKEKNTNQMIKQVESSIKFTLICSFIVLPIFIALGQPITFLLLKNITAGEYLSNASWLIVFMGTAQLTTSILNSLGLEVKTFIYYIISSVFLIASVFILPQKVGIYSLLYGLGISSIIVSILNIRKINKTLCTNNYHIKTFLKLILIAVPTTFLTKFVYSLLILVFPLFVSIALSCIISFVSFISLLLASGQISMEFITSNISSLKKSTKSNHKTTKQTT